LNKAGGLALIAKTHKVRRTAMRLALFMLGIFLAAVAIGTGAKAQNYPWCALYNEGGELNCGFSTVQQCMTDVSGIGGFCTPNNTKSLKS
jgi:hypothetical protein